MPYAEILMPEKFMTNQEKSTLAKSLTKILIKSEGLKDNPISNSITLLEIKDSDTFYIGGEKGNQEKVIIKIYAFSDAFNKKTTEDLYSSITTLFMENNEKTKSQNGRNIWCMIIPLGENGFGVGGIPITLEMTKQLVSSYKNTLASNV
ncbi:tautomerase family protein [Flavivirga jejuensis]|uniref:Tautomerase family protein n=1 Tax=Flavivirga jejuensis TaxID=870487 RepID=A0ABT8WUC2_9FLAO|nr:tautomerase family protein [Flavivirga jejuensis]MDO5976776.1 tautomerase family protein [Flavivirga jejuensis]